MTGIPRRTPCASLGVLLITKDYFKKHNLLSSLFDNPPADIFAGFHLDPATSNQLQNLYGVHGNSQGMGGAPAVTILAQTLAEVVGKGTFEVVFKRPLSVQMINLRMGGFLRPAAKNKKQPELADPDFDFVFPDAEIALGRGRAPAGLNQSVPRGARPQVPAHGLCSVYEPLTNFSGREFFWRSPTSRPAAGVECVKVTLLEAPKSNVILRTIRIRSLKTTAAARRMTPEETAQVFQPKWQDEMRSWAKNVLVAFGSGALFGSSLRCSRGFNLPKFEEGREKFTEEDVTWWELKTIHCAV
ncbi:unnamed protein product [Durusdinium trenchii]|uniref:Uncharacterized protein n=1 Tax=Durusdinium trenchii TaxID=1381693 RepID=A0ABP0MT93_9DINO